jgi:hypothetical protein
LSNGFPDWPCIRTLNISTDGVSGTRHGTCGGGLLQLEPSKW